jgi:CHAT domain-containing protein/tetratricopeptide (TPR) repeat protein
MGTWGGLLAACAAIILPTAPLAAQSGPVEKGAKILSRPVSGKVGKGSAETSYRPLVERLEAARDAGNTDMVATLLPIVGALVLGTDDASQEDQDYALPVLQSAHALIGDFAGERRIIDRRAAIAAKREGPKSYAAAILAVDIADLLRREGRPAEGEAHLRRAVSANTDPVITISLQSALASYLDDAQHLADAIDAYRVLLDLQVRQEGPDSDDVFETVERLSWDLGQTGRHAEALALLETTIPRAEAAWRATGATETYNGTMESLTTGLRYANLLERQADHLGAQSKITQSDFYFEAANKLRTRYFSRPTPVVARTYNNMAFRQNFQGRFALAEKNARTALDIFEGFFSRTDVSASITYAKYKYNLAAALLGQGRAQEALPLLRFGVPIQRELAPDHPDLVILLTTLSRAIVAADGDLDEALSMSREAAAIAGDSTTHDPMSMAYGALMEATAAGMDVAGRTDADVLRNEMFIAAQDLEQSTAGQAMAQAAARAMAGEGPLGALITRKQQLADRARALNLAVTASVLASENYGLEENRAALAQVVQELAAADAQLKKDFPEFDDLVSPAALSLSDVRARLAADEALILIVPNGADYYLFATSPDQEQITVLVKASEPIARLVARLRCRMGEASCVSDADMDPTSDQPGALQGIDAFFPRFDRGAAHRLYTTVFAPLEPALGKAKRIFVTVAGPLGGLPLPVLVTAFDPAKDKAEAGDAEALKQSAWLGDKYAFITLPAVSALRIARPLPKTGGGAAREFLGYGAPSLLGRTGAARSVEQGGRRLMRGAMQGIAVASPDALRKLSPLPGTEIELKSMAAALNAPPSGLRLGPAATEAALKQDAGLASAGIIAFATHGLLPKEFGRAAEPGLVFTPPQTASAQDDGLLTASEASRLSLTAEWLILSACNTASSDGTPGSQSLSGLARAFLHAGAKALLASHWRVSDEVTAVLTVETMRFSRSGLPKAEALRQAMIAVRTGKRADGSAVPGWKEFWAHPAAWSPFVLVAADGS